MARTIMVSNKVYADLKKAKGNDKSFSEVIAESLEAAKPKKSFGALMEFAGVFKGDKEYDEAFKWLRKMEKMSKIFIAVKSSSQYDEFLHKIQQPKMKELWNNKQDEEWENA